MPTGAEGRSLLLRDRKEHRAVGLPTKNPPQAVPLRGSTSLARKTGAGALRRPVLVALGLREDGKKEVIDFRLARGESAAEWERFLDDLY